MGFKRQNPGCACCDQGSCDDCFVPFVDSGHTKTRYPKRAVLSFSGSVLDTSGEVPPSTDCGFCDCFNNSWVLNFQGKVFDSTATYDYWSWGYPQTRPAAGPFSFGASGTGGECSYGRDLLFTDKCPRQNTPTVGRDGPCDDLDPAYPPDEDLATFGPRVPTSVIAKLAVPTDIVHILQPVLLDLTVFGASKRIFISGTEISAGPATQTLDPAIDLTNDCGEYPAVVLPDETLTYMLSGFLSGDIGTGESCSFESAVCSITFMDWEERSFPVPA